MKKWESRRSKQNIHASNRRGLRNINTKATPQKKKRHSKSSHKDRRSDMVLMPHYINLYKPDHAQDFLKKFDEIESKAASCESRNKSLTICLRHTYIITAAAGLLLLARLENLKQKLPSLRLKFTTPPKYLPKVDGRTPTKNTVESVLNRIGVYELAGLPKKVMHEASNVKCWEVIKGQDVSSSEAGVMLKCIESKLGLNLKPMFRPLIEAMSNAVEHAYHKDVFDQEEIPPSKWWMFASSDGGKLTVLLCDIGVGIPKTLKLTQSSELLNKITSTFGFTLQKDHSYIQASLEVKKSRTELGYRGKGGQDLRSSVSRFNKASLLICSNKGVYRFKQPNKLSSDGEGTIEKMYDLDKSIKGTLIEWTVELP